MLGLSSNFFGGASSGDEERFQEASGTAQGRFGDIYEGAMGGADFWGGRSRERSGTLDDRMDSMWASAQEGGAFGLGGAGSGAGAGGPRYRRDRNSLWGDLRDTGDLTGGDWDAARGTYTDYNETGGWDDDRMRDFRARAIAGTDMYDPRADAASRVQGGWGAGTSGSELARQKAIAEMRRTGSFEAESAIASSVDEGRRWGASSLEGLGGRVQEGRITGQSELDRERREAHARARARAAANAAAGRANANDVWGRQMGLQGMGYGNLAATGGDLPYYQAAGTAAGAGWGVGSQTYDTMAGRPGAMNQIASAADDLRSMGPPQYGGGDFRGFGQQGAGPGGGGGGGGGGMQMPMQMPMMGG